MPTTVTSLLRGFLIPRPKDKDDRDDDVDCSSGSSTSTTSYQVLVKWLGTIKNNNKKKEIPKMISFKKGIDQYQLHNEKDHGTYSKVPLGEGLI
jgi:hypothetical protein